MLAEERFSLILDLLARQRTATVQELCEALNASESTIRRDLNELDKQGKLNKVHGGATLPDSPFRTDEPTMAAKEELAVSQKQSIAQAAADQAHDREDGVGGVGHGLALGGLADQAFAFREADDGGRRARAFRILDHPGLRTIHDGNAGVGGPEVNTDDFGHVCIPLLQAMFRQGP